ncbi:MULTISPECIES: aryl-sulfate sulfotransferase [unclassified Carboxylicivirga]|uniref:aryl-sulfate sulfotransferase n=1 Tax=Carboxylicivirga TaxID=1628153 RepID=UPI003D338AF7
MKRILFIVFAVCCALIACDKHDELKQGFATVDTYAQLPHCVIINADFDADETAYIKLVDAGSQEVIWSRKADKHRNKFVVGGFQSGQLLDYELQLDDQVIDEGQITLPTLPDDYAAFVDVKTEGKPDMGGKCLLVNKMSMPSGVFLFDENGQVVWSRLSDNFVKMVKMTKRGTLLTLEDNTGDKFGNGNLIYETTLSGDTLVALEYGKGGFDRMAHHDVVLTARGTYAFITNVNVNGMVVDGITELNAYGDKVWDWDMAQHVLPVEPGQTFNQPWGNSIFEDEDGNYLLSFRALSQIWTVNSATGKVLMKFGQGSQGAIGKDMLPMYQHHAQLPKANELLLFDNGHFTERPSSRIMKYLLNENGEVEQVSTCINLPQDLFSPFMSAVEPYPDGYIVASSITKKIAGLNWEGQKLWEMKMGDRMFRAQLVNWEAY